jgi:hypothetical protein
LFIDYTASKLDYFELINMIGVDGVHDVVDDDCDAAAVLTDGSRPTLLREHEEWVNRPLL